MVKKYAGHPIPLPEGTRVDSVKVDDISSGSILLLLMPVSQKMLKNKRFFS